MPSVYHDGLSSIFLTLCLSSHLQVLEESRAAYPWAAVDGSPYNNVRRSRAPDLVVSYTEPFKTFFDG